MPILSRHRLHLIARVLSLVLLVAQLGAEAHAYSHLVTDPLEVPSKVQFCGACLSFAPLLGAAVGSHCVTLVDRCEAERIAPMRSIPVPSPFPSPAFQSRAPPALL